MLFGDYLKQWLISIKNNVEEITYENYEMNINNMAIYFDKKKIYLTELTAFDIQEFCNNLYKLGRTGNTAIHYHVLIKQAVENAFKFGLISKNIMDFVDRPKKNRYQAEFYNKEELMKLFECVKGDPLETVIYIMAFYGLRRSEVLGLKWSAIDFENKVVYVNHKVVELKGRLLAKNKMKNKTSNRTLPLIPQVEKILLEEKKKQQQNKRIFGNCYNTTYSEYVCLDNLGNILKPGYLTQHFSMLQEKHGLKHIRFHDLRHSCASLMLANGIPMKQIQEWLGHSTFQTTADTYAHLDYTSKLSSANTIANVLSFDDNVELNNKTYEVANIYIEQPKSIDDEIEELERLLEEKRKQKEQDDFEM